MAILAYARGVIVSRAVDSAECCYQWLVPGMLVSASWLAEVLGVPPGNQRGELVGLAAGVSVAVVDGQRLQCVNDQL